MTTAKEEYEYSPVSKNEDFEKNITPPTFQIEPFGPSSRKFLYIAAVIGKCFNFLLHRNSINIKKFWYQPWFIDKKISTSV